MTIFAKNLKRKTQPPCRDKVCAFMNPNSQNKLITEIKTFTFNWKVGFRNSSNWLLKTAETEKLSFGQNFLRGMGLKRTKFSLISFKMNRFILCFWFWIVISKHQKDIGANKSISTANISRILKPRNRVLPFPLTTQNMKIKNTYFGILLLFLGIKISSSWMWEWKMYTLHKW